MVELADALDSKSSGVTPREGSIPSFGTIFRIRNPFREKRRGFWFIQGALLIVDAKDDRRRPVPSGLFLPLRGHHCLPQLYHQDSLSGVVSWFFMLVIVYPAGLFYNKDNYRHRRQRRE